MIHGPLHLPHCDVHLEDLEVRRDGGIVPLTALEARLLRYLWERAGQVVPRQDVLEQVWGYHRDSQSRAVNATVTRLRTKIEADPKAPAVLLTVRAVGLKLVVPPLAAPAVHPRRGFFGREAELARLAEGGGLTTLVGPAGIGKTRLARQVAFTGRFVVTWFCDLSAARDAGSVIDAVHRTLDITAGSGDDAARLARVGRALATHGSALLILDNFEQVAPWAATVLTPLLDAAPRCTILVTSRKRLGLADERALPVPRLALAAARAMFCDRAAAVIGAFEVHSERPDLLDEVLELLERRPLAIELAAARMNVFDLPTLRDRLSDRFAVLDVRPRGAEPRHAALRAALDWSWDLLEDQERAALAQCTVFVGGFTLEAAEAVIEPPVAAVLGRLVDASWVHRVPPARAGDPLRFDLFESTREYVGARDPDLAAARMRHAAYYAAFGAPEWFETWTPRRGALINGLVWELANLESAVVAALAMGDLALAADACKGLVTARIRVGPLERALEMVDRVCDALADRPEAHRLRAWRAYLKLELSLDDAAQADAVRVGDAPDAGFEAHYLARFVLGYLHRKRGETAAARAAWEACLHLARAQDCAWRVADATKNLAGLYADQADLASAETLYRRVYDVYRTLGYTQGQASVLYDLGALCLLRGQLREAEDGFRRALERRREGGPAQGEYRARIGLARVALAAGRPAEAVQHATVGLDIARRSVEGGVGVASLNLAIAHLDLGQLADATRHALDTAEWAHARGWDVLEGLARVVLAELVAAEGNHERAADLVAQAGALIPASGRPDNRIRFHGRAGTVAMAAGDRPRALQHLHAARALFATLGMADRSPVGRLVSRLEHAIGG